MKVKLITRDEIGNRPILLLAGEGVGFSIGPHLLPTLNCLKCEKPLIAGPIPLMENIIIQCHLCNTLHEPYSESEI